MANQPVQKFLTVILDNPFLSPMKCSHCDTIVSCTSGDRSFRYTIDGKEYELVCHNSPTYRCPTCEVEWGHIHNTRQLLSQVIVFLNKEGAHKEASSLQAILEAWANFDNRPQSPPR